MKHILVCFIVFLLPCHTVLQAGESSTTPPPGAMDADRYKTALDKSLKTMRDVITKGPYKDTVDSLNNYSAPDWYADAKLGIFIHYGLFSVPGFSGVGCWYGNKMYDPTASAFTFHRQEYGPQDAFGYKDFAPYLTAERFDADQWISLFKEAGACFVVPVSCFHDGFAMWNSKLTDWNAVKTGPKRDYDGLLAKAARKEGMKFGVAWHAFFRPTFFATGRRPGTDIKPPDAGPPWSFYGPDKVTPEFVNDGLARLQELVDGYQPDLVWFDFDTQFVKPADLRQFAAFYFNRAAQWKRQVAINDKHPDFFPPRSIVLDFE
jgi:alpha-L-fucosidase